MAKPVFTSFKEIDHQLRILQLQREIGKEQAKLHLRKAKGNLLPTVLLGGLGQWTKGFIISFLANKILKRRR